MHIAFLITPLHNREGLGVGLLSHMVNVHYYESRQAGGRLLAPAAHLAVLG